MTLTLILMRHAKSSWDDPALNDHDRPLNKRGIASAQAMGQWLRDADHLPDTCISSTSLRTTQTFERLGLDAPIVFTRKLYHAGAAQMMDVLQDATANRVLMLGHNPGIAEFAERLVATPPRHDRFMDYPTCATTVIGFDAATWRDIGWHRGQPMDFAIPRELA